MQYSANAVVHGYGHTIRHGRISLKVSARLNVLYNITVEHKMRILKMTVELNFETRHSNSAVGASRVRLDFSKSDRCTECTVYKMTMEYKMRISKITIKLTQ